MFSYEVDVAGVKVKHSKIYLKELFEEEKAEEAAKNPKAAKAAPAKGAKGQKEEELSAEELARIETEKAALEESKRSVLLEIL